MQSTCHMSLNQVLNHHKFFFPLKSRTQFTDSACRIAFHGLKTPLQYTVELSLPFEKGETLELSLRKESI